MSIDLPPSVRSALKFAYFSLRSKTRLLEGSIMSPYEDFFSRAATALNPHRLQENSHAIPLSEVESFHLGRMSQEEFVLKAYNRLKSVLAVSVQRSGDFSPLYSVIWEMYSTEEAHSAHCLQVSSSVGRKLWEVFIKLDSENEMKVHIDDLTMVILKIFEANNHQVEEKNIQEWFCGETNIDFWSFFTSLVEKYSSLLQPTVIQNLYDSIILGVIHTGKMMKKGHHIKNWKERWFVLTTSSMTYYESQDVPTQKGSICINANTLVQTMLVAKGHPFRFKVTDGVSGTPYEISAVTLEDQQKWIDNIKLVIEMHKVEGRNHLHKWRQVKEKMNQPWTVGKQQKVTHKPLSPTRSAPPTSQKPVQRYPLLSTKSQDSDANIGAEVNLRVSPKSGTNSSSTHEVPPPLPPQMFIDDTTVGCESPSRQRVTSDDKEEREQKLRRRHSSILGETDLHQSLEEVDHVSKNGLDYAVINFEHKKSTTDPPAPQPPPPRPANDEPSAGYVQLSFQQEPNSNPHRTPDCHRRKDVSYSQVLFTEEPKQDKELAQDLKKKKPPPPMPPKYEGSAPIPKKRMNKYKSDSQVTSASSPEAASPSIHTSSPQLGELEGNGAYDNVPFPAPRPVPQKRTQVSPSSDVKKGEVERPYVNMEFGGVPKVPPRKSPRGALPPTLSEEEPPPPPVPVRRT